MEPGFQHPAPVHANSLPPAPPKPWLLLEGTGQLLFFPKLTDFLWLFTHISVTRLLALLLGKGGCGTTRGIDKGACLKDITAATTLEVASRAEPGAPDAGHWSSAGEFWRKEQGSRVGGQWGGRVDGEGGRVGGWGGRE